MVDLAKSKTIQINKGYPMVQFCPECSNLLRKKKEEGKAYLACKCGYQEIVDTNLDQDLAQKKQQALDENLVIVSEEDKISVLPIVKKVCPKCGHKEAETWFTQIRSSDEPSTHFFKCVKCKRTWREE